MFQKRSYSPKFSLPHVLLLKDVALNELLYLRAQAIDDNVE